MIKNNVLLLTIIIFIFISNSSVFADELDIFSSGILNPLFYKKRYIQKQFCKGSFKYEEQKLLNKIYNDKRKVDQLINKTCYLTIIIDDCGSRREDLKNFINLNIPLTFSILPGLKYTDIDKKVINNSNFEIMLHMPMESESLQTYPVDLVIDTLSTKEQNLNKLKKAIKQINLAVGINNHQGSYLSYQAEELDYILDEVKRNNMFFIDSFTSSRSIIYDMAYKKGIPVAKRNIFIDNVNNVNYICSNIRKAIKYAKENRFCIAIGHAKQVTGLALQKMQDELLSSNIEIIFASDMVNLQMAFLKDKQNLAKNSNINNIEYKRRN